MSPDLRTVIQLYNGLGAKEKQQFHSYYAPLWTACERNGHKFDLVKRKQNWIMQGDQDQIFCSKCGVPMPDVKIHHKSRCWRYLRWSYTSLLRTWRRRCSGTSGGNVQVGIPNPSNP